MSVLDIFESEDNGQGETCPTCSALLGIESPRLGCEDPDGCGSLKEDPGEEEVEELDFDE